MASLSFVIIYCPERLSNLIQMLRLLARRNSGLLDEQVVLVSDTSHPPIDHPFRNCRYVDLHLDTYWKPRMTNEGVKQATNDVIALLDCDRVLPVNYFADHLASISRGTILTTKYLFNLNRPCSDEEIESTSTTPDHRSLDNTCRRKNLFAGNTLMFREDYWSMGGYDERYVGYGYADTDMTRTAMTSGYNIEYTEESEYHLHHDNYYRWRGVVVDKQVHWAIAAINALNYCLKWRLPFDDGVRALLDQVERSEVSQPTELMAEYYRLRRKFVLL